MGIKEKLAENKASDLARRKASEGAAALSLLDELRAECLERAKSIEREVLQGASAYDGAINCDRYRPIMEAANGTDDTRAERGTHLALKTFIESEMPGFTADVYVSHNGGRNNISVRIADDAVETPAPRSAYPIALKNWCGFSRDR